MSKIIKKVIPVLKPLLPKADSLLQYLKIIDENRWYTNFGPLTEEFENRLSSLFNIEKNNILTIANGTDALTVALMGLHPERNKKTKCIMPSWTFVATAAAAKMAGLEPVFADIELENWAITPETTLQAIKELGIDIADIHSVIPVSPFGAPIQLSDWMNFQNETGIKVLIDAAASFDTFSQKSLTNLGELPTMISLHATKVFGIGEGAILISKDTEMIKFLRQKINFGFSGTREAKSIGTNSKLSEYASAIGLAELDNWTTKRQQWERVTQEYLKHEDTLRRKGIYFSPGFGNTWISSYCNITVSSNEEKVRILNNLKANGVDTREWWGSGCHAQLAYKEFPAANLKNTLQLSERTIGLPLYTDLSAQDINHICSLL